MPPCCARKSLVRFHAVRVQGQNIRTCQGKWRLDVPLVIAGEEAQHCSDDGKKLNINADAKSRVTRNGFAIPCHDLLLNHI